MMIISLFIIVVLYRVIETLPLPRGTQSHMGVPTAHVVELPANRTNDLEDIVHNEHAVVALHLKLLQMMRDMQTAMMAQMSAHLL
jgi:hypothetical protein